MRLRVSSVGLSAAVALVVGVGCASQTGGNLAGYCQETVDCLNGECVDGRCVAMCTTGDECAVGEQCVRERCVPIEGEDAGVDAVDGGARTDGGARIDGGTAGDDGGANPPRDGGLLGSDGGPRDGGRAEQCHERDAREACGPSLGTCRQGTRICNGEFWGPCVGAVGPAEEQCDGLDHDCDGVPNNRAGGCECRNGDTRDCYNGPAGSLGMGTCRAGAQTCNDGAWGSCVGAVEPRPGVCGELSCTGGLNPGCDCLVGAQQACYTGPANTRMRGICRDGSQACLATASGAMWAECTGQTLPESVDRCDGTDRNCDGTPNNPPSGCVCVQNATQPCYTGPASSRGQGTCRDGTQTCTLVGGSLAWSACSGEVTPQPGNCAVASCVGADVPNPGCDCINGRTRACYTGAMGTQGVGACRGGTQTCSGGSFGMCAGEVRPQTPDACVPPTATMATHASSDRTCNGILERRNPTATPNATAATAVAITAPSGFVRAVQVEPLDTVTLQGGATDVDGAGSFSYRWRLVSAPANNTAGLSGAPGGRPTDVSTQQNPTLFAQLGGDYAVAVKAVDSTGCESAEVQLLVRVKPQSAIHLQLTWDQSVDVDLQLGQGAAAPIFQANACYWGGLNPDWGVVDPSLDIDDLAGCNPENINFGSIGGTRPPLNTAYSVWVHYYCNRRGHRPNATNLASLCYSPTAVTTPVNATLKVFVDGQVAKIHNTNDDAIFTTSLTVTQTWKPAVVTYDASGVWRITRSTDPKGTSGGSACTGVTTCVCGTGVPNAGDPYCGTGGAACRQRFP